MEGILVGRTSQILYTLEHYNIDGPYFICISFWGMKNKELGDSLKPDVTNKFYEDIVSPFAVEIDSAIDPEKLRDKLSKPIDSIYQAT